MKKTYFKDEESWLEGRMGKITGTRVKTLLSKRDLKPLKGYYEVLAERVAIPANEENVMYRGKRLEDIAIEKFSEITGKKVSNDLVLWTRDDDENIAVSPDGSVIGEPAAVEVKCLNSAAQIEAFLTKKIPEEYESQKIQYFVVNDKLKKLYFVFYDPRLPIDLFWIEVNREDIKEDIQKSLELQRQTLFNLEEDEKKLTII